MTGAVTRVRLQDIGFIAADGCGRPWELRARRDAAALGGVDRLRQRQRIGCAQDPVMENPDRSRAIRQAPLAERRRRR
jgi:hypothetical protein